MIMTIIKKVVWSMCILYTINVIISATGYLIPINIYTISLTAFLGVPLITGLIILKYYI